MEAANSEPISLVPVDDNSYTSQICYMGPQQLTDLGLKVGDPVKVYVSAEGFYLGQAWPRADGWNGPVQCTPLVTVNCTKASTNADKVLKLEGCQPSVKLNQVKVTVVCNDSSDIHKWKNDATYRETLSRNVRDTLHGLILTNGSKVHCENLQLGKMFGFDCIEINNTKPEDSICRILRKTQVSVCHMISKERYQQTQKKAPKLGGLARQYEQLCDLLRISSLKNLGISYPKGVLLRGPPGTGKSSIVKLVAADTQSYLTCITCSKVVGSRPGEGEENLRQTFEKVFALAEEGPCILFLDEIDSMCKRGGGKGGMGGRMLSQLLLLLDEAQTRQSLLVVAATNRPAALDPALRRPGRLDREMFIGVPNQEQRLSILECLTSTMTLECDLDLNSVAEATPGYVGADLAALCQQACLSAYRNKQQDEVQVSREDFTTALHAVVPSTQRGSDLLVDHRPVHWHQIGGLTDIKAQIKQCVEWPLKHPEAFARLGIKRPKGILLHGPPGCAKTMLVRAAATSCHVTFLAISGAQLYSSYVGDSERKLAEVFQQARAGAPSILFIDEVDGVVGKRGGGERASTTSERVLSTLLNEMDGVGQKLDQLQRRTGSQVAEGQALPETEKPDTSAVDNNDVLLVCATNRPDMLDDALLRPGRIDRCIYVPPPDLQGRVEILKVHTHDMPLCDVDLPGLAAATDGFTGADLKNLCTEAALHAMSIEGLDVQHIKQCHFDHVLQHVRPSLSTQQLQSYQKLTGNFLTK